VSRAVSLILDGLTVPTTPIHPSRVQLVLARRLSFASESTLAMQEFAYMRTAPFAWPVGIGMVLAGFAASVVTIKYGSLDGARARFGGAMLFCEVPTQHVGPILAGELAAVEYDLRNLTSEPVKIYGAYTECSCTVVGDLPLEIQPGETSPLCVTVGTDPVDAGKMFETKVELYYGPAGPPLVLQMSVNIE